jgi:transposase-like protein
LRLYNNPGAIIQVFNSLCSLFGANAQVIQRLTLQTLDKRKYDFPNLAEEVNLLYHSGVDVRQIIELYGISQATAYVKLREPFTVRFEFLAEDRTELIKFLTVLRQFRDEVL